MTKVTNNTGTDAGNDAHTGPTTNRRQLLQRIGLLAGAAYAAPVLLQLADAHAGKGSGKGGGGRKGSGGGKGSGRGRGSGRGKGSGKKGSGKKGSKGSKGSKD